MQAMTRDRNDIKCHFCGRVGHSKIKCPFRVKQQQENGGQQPQQREGQQNHPRRQHQRNREGGRGPVWCSCHKTTSNSDADCRARRRRRVDGKAHIAATGPSRINGICSAYDCPEENDQPERPLISFTATEVHPTVAIAVEQSHTEEPLPFGSLSASPPWPCEERANPAISLGGQRKTELLLHVRGDGR